MDRLFLDANVLFSAAYRADAGLLALWKLKDITLCSSRYALEEARINLENETQKKRLTELSETLELFDATTQELPPQISLPAKRCPDPARSYSRTSNPPDHWRPAAFWRLF